METAAELITQIYIGYYDRAPDPEGLQYWIDRYEDGMSLLDIAESFSVQSESTAKYPFLANPDVGSAEAFITSVYMNLFNRMPDQEGLDYWLGELENGKPVGRMIIDIISGAVTDPDASVLANKTEVGLYFAQEAAEIGNFEYDAAAAVAAEAALDGVTDDDATVAEGKAEIDLFIGDNGVERVTLTEGADTVSGQEFTAPRGFTPGGTDQVNTLNDDDVLTGTGERNVLNFSFVNDADTGDASIAPTLNNIQVLNVDVRLDEEGTFDIQDSTGVEEINLKGIDDADFNVDNIQSTTDLELAIRDSSAGDSSVSFFFDDEALEGDADEVGLTLDNVDIEDIILADEDFEAGLGIETLNLVAEGGDTEVDSISVEDAETIVLTGDADLQLGEEVQVIGPDGRVEADFRATGLANVVGSLTTFDASAYTGNLDVAFGAELTATLDDTSGVDVDFAFTGGSGDDIVRLNAGLDEGDVVDGGAGANTIFLYDTAEEGSITNIQSLRVENFGVGTITVDTSIITELEDVTVRNIASGSAAVFDLEEVSAVVAADIAIEHGVSGANALDDNEIEVDLAADTASDLVGVSIEEGVNVDPRFNFLLDATADTAEVEDITLNDVDSESNTVGLVNFLDHDGTLTVTGGQAGEFLNLDSEVDAGLTDQSGIFGLDNDGGEDDIADEDIGDVVVDFEDGVADRLIFETIDASTFAGDLIVRLGDEDQDITTGTGDDTIIFDAVDDARAGLTILDTLDAGDGDDTLVLDGENVIVEIGSSEWENVTNVENIRLVGNDAVGAVDAGDFGDNAYNLRLTDDLIDENGVVVGGGRVINIINDNDLTNEDDIFDTNGDAAANDGVTIDARTLSSDRTFSYNGEEGFDETADRFIMADANLNGMAEIDGGAVDEDGTANDDVLEVRNSAVVTLGDIAMLANIGTIEFSNDTAALQSSTLVLDNETIDRLVNDQHDAFEDDGTDIVEVLTIVVSGNTVVGAATELTIELDETIDTNDVNFVVVVEGNAAVILDSDADLVINGDGGDNIITGGTGDDTINGGGGNDTLAGGAGDDVITGGTGADTMTGGDGNDTFVIALGDSSNTGTLATSVVDIITDFNDLGDDSLDFVTGPAGAGEYIEGGVFATYELAAADAEVNAAGNQYYAAQVGADVFVFFDESAGGSFTGEPVVRLVGTTLADIDATDII